MDEAESLQAQYLKAMDLLDAEITRFWTRFNIATGVQLLLIAAIAASTDKLVAQPVIAVVITVIGLVFSIATILIVWFSWDIVEAMRGTLEDIEDRSHSLILLRTYQRRLGRRMGRIMVTCTGMAGALIVCWIVVAVAMLVR